MNAEAKAFGRFVVNSLVDSLWKVSLDSLWKVSLGSLWEVPLDSLWEVSLDSLWEVLLFGKRRDTTPWYSEPPFPLFRLFRFIYKLPHPSVPLYCSRRGGWGRGGRSSAECFRVISTVR